MNTLGNIISESRKKQGLSQEALAEAATVNLRTIQRIENNYNTPRGKTLELLCDALNLPIDELRLDSTESKNLWINKFIDIFFLTLLNVILGFLISFLTVFRGANINSYVAAYLLCVLIPFFITYKTQHLSGLQRAIRFGSFTIPLSLLHLATEGPSGILSANLIPCLMLFLSVLYYGEHLLNSNEKQNNS